MIDPSDHFDVLRRSFEQDREQQETLKSSSPEDFEVTAGGGITIERAGKRISISATE